MPTPAPQPDDLPMPPLAGEDADREAEAQRFAGCSLETELIAIEETAHERLFT